MLMIEAFLFFPVWICVMIPTSRETMAASVIMFKMETAYHQDNYPESGLAAYSDESHSRDRCTGFVSFPRDVAVNTGKPPLIQTIPSIGS